MPYLIADKSSKSYRIFNFTSIITIGRGRENDIILSDHDDSAISRNHAHIKKKNGGYFLVDHSSNGTLVEDKPVKKVQLVDGSRFQVVNYFFTFVDGPEPSGTVLEQHSQSPKEKDLNSFDVEKTVFTCQPEKVLENKLRLKKQLKKNGIIVENDTILSLFMDIKEIVKINVPVLILGEPGTGKEKIAHILHQFAEPEGKFVPVNCSSVPEGIFESELFGSVKGAFHEAQDKPGKIEQAENGTLFLDEIGDMAMIIQPKLLRFLEDKILTRLGSSRSKKLNVRIIAATNQDLQSMMSSGTFRSDLYQRLACITLRVPPLRDRKEDILPLANFFLGQLAKEYDLALQVLSDDAKQLLLTYHWPGNIRELNNVLLNTAIRNRNKVITASLLALGSEDIKSATLSISRNPFLSLESLEKKHIIKALAQADGVKTKAARLLEISRDTLYNKIKKYNIS